MPYFLSLADTFRACQGKKCCLAAASVTAGDDKPEKLHSLRKSTAKLIALPGPLHAQIRKGHTDALLSHSTACPPAGDELRVSGWERTCCKARVL